MKKSMKFDCFCLQVTLYHLLKLFQSDSSAMPKKTVVSEFYDEMVSIRLALWGNYNINTLKTQALNLFPSDISRPDGHDAAAPEHHQTADAWRLQTRDRVWVLTFTPGLCDISQLIKMSQMCILPYYNGLQFNTTLSLCVYHSANLLKDYMHLKKQADVYLVLMLKYEQAIKLCSERNTMAKTK